MSLQSLSSASYLSGQMRMNLEKIKAVTKWPIPKVWKCLQCFLSLAHFYRQFICDFSQTASPFTQLTSTLRRFEWTPEANSAFYKLKELFTPVPILSHPNPSICKFFVRTPSSFCKWKFQTPKLELYYHNVLRCIIKYIHPCAFFLPSPLTCQDKL